MSSSSAASHLSMFVSALALSALVTQSGANAASGERVIGTLPTNLAATASAASTLPIEKGIYFADYSGSCAKATEVFFYDGSAYGYVSQALPGDRMNSPRDASFEAHAISRTGVSKRGSKEFEADLVGFTRIWSPDDFISDAGYPMDARGVKPTTDGGFIFREGSMSARQMEYDDITYRKCAASQLSLAMQSTVRKYLPGLANGPLPSSSNVAPQAKPVVASTSTAIPLAVGYYAYVEGTFSTCAKPVITPWYFDGARFWEESDISDPKHQYTSEAVKWDMVAADRFRITYRDRDGNGKWDSQQSVNEYVITGPQSFAFVGTVGSSFKSNENYQLCSAAQLPAKSRWYKGGN